MTKVTKAASPFSFAAAKASSILPPTPRSISETGGISIEATFRALVALALAVDLDGTLAAEKATDDRSIDIKTDQPNINEKNCILGCDENKAPERVCGTNK